VKIRLLILDATYGVFAVAGTQVANTIPLLTRKGLGDSSCAISLQLGTGPVSVPTCAIKSRKIHERQL